jgi:dynamin 1/3
LILIGTRIVGVISKIDQAASDQKTIAAVEALLLNKGPTKAQDIPWVALICQSVSTATPQSGSSGSENSSETAWRAESDDLKVMSMSLYTCVDTLLILTWWLCKTTTVFL